LFRHDGSLIGVEDVWPGTPPPRGMKRGQTENLNGVIVAAWWQYAPGSPEERAIAAEDALAAAVDGEPRVACRQCDGVIAVGQYRFGSPETGWEHMSGECAAVDGEPSEVSDG
jgi:hypothetical protein